MMQMMITRHLHVNILVATAFKRNSCIYKSLIKENEIEIQPAFSYLEKPHLVIAALTYKFRMYVQQIRDQ